MCLESFEKEIDNLLFRSYEKRLSSFKQWKGKVKPELLARSGFYYISIQDVCRCFYCGIEIFDWVYDDCPIDEHYRLSKNCDLIECLCLNKKCEEPIIKCVHNSVEQYKIFIVVFVFIIIFYQKYFNLNC